MTRILFLGAAVMLVVSTSLSVKAQRNCGLGIRLQNMARENPALYKQIKEQELKATAQALAIDNSAAKIAKTTTQSPIPLVFHFILTTAQYNLIGQDTGIIRRVKSQLQSLNEDYNGANADKSLIPGAFAPYYANMGIQFGLAKATSSSTAYPGVEIKILSSGSVYDVNEDCYTAKEATGVGLAAWDVSKYLNIWVVNIGGAGSGGGTILGITTSPQWVGAQAGTHTILASEVGIVLNYQAIGRREFASQYFVQNIDLGRTLTHEMGHYFELLHTWGDDGGLCPNNGGYDDGISDTPPEADATYCNFPRPSGSSCPTFPLYDSCTKTGNGIMFMNYMDYVDDRAMQMFTLGQRNVVLYQIAQSDRESWSLTQNPGLATTGVSTVSGNAFQISPNPARDYVHISLSSGERLTSIDVVNMMGQSVVHIATNGADFYDIATANMPRGIYFVQCHFAEGTLVKKIVLQ